MKLGLSNILLF